MLDYLLWAFLEVLRDIVIELWRVFRTGIGRGKSHDGDILKLR